MNINTELEARNYRTELKYDQDSDQLQIRVFDNGFEWEVK